VLARPVRGRQAGGGLVLKASRGYGSRSEIFLIGRVFRQSGRSAAAAADSLFDQFREVRRRVARRSVPGKAVVAQFYGARERVTTDQDGYFRIHLRPRDRPAPDRVWHEIDLHLEDDPAVRAQGSIFIPPEHCAFVVISDIDDTVMHTGVASKAVMLWRLFMQGAESRVAFPGVAAFLRALHAGASGVDHNPTLYVSRAPWGNYEVLDAFFRLHDIPVGPLLFLREWGLTVQSPLPRRGKGHKLELIRNMLELYRDLPFVLLGDSGQRDPEIYARVVQEHPGRVLAIYIRNVSQDPGRLRAIEALAVQVADEGSGLVLAADSFAMAEHAAARGLIAPGALEEVLRARRAEGGETVASATREVVRHSPGATREAVEQGELRDALGADPQQGAAPNVLVEPSTARTVGPDGGTRSA
jgi:phosphatidate phosphatase APP1